MSLSLSLKTFVSLLRYEGGSLSGSNESFIIINFSLILLYREWVEREMPCRFGQYALNKSK